jgi:hypothetical protein
MAVQDDPVRHLFDNTGDLYYGRRFEMLAALEANFKPATFSHAFTTLLSLVIDKQAEEEIHEFRACFEGHLHDMSRSTVRIPPILQAMLFLLLRALHHPCYKAIIDLFASKQKDISITSINSIVLDAQSMDELSFFGSNGNPDPVMDDLLDTPSPPEHSQDEAIDDDEYPPAQNDPPPVNNVNPTFDPPLEIICLMARMMILSQSALDSGLLFFLFPGFLSVFGRFSLFLDGSNPPRLVFPVPFCWVQGWGVLVHPWSARVA